MSDKGLLGGDSSASAGGAGRLEREGRLGGGGETHLHRSTASQKRLHPDIT